MFWLQQVYLILDYDNLIFFPGFSFLQWLLAYASAKLKKGSSFRTFHHQAALFSYSRQVWSLIFPWLGCCIQDINVNLDYENDFNADVVAGIIELPKNDAESLCTDNNRKRSAAHGK